MLLRDLPTLRRAAREIFDAALTEVDAGRAVRRAVGVDGSRLRVFETEFDLREGAKEIYCVAIGKAATQMAAALEEQLGERIVEGVVSAPPAEVAALPARWRVYAGGHPLPNEASLEAARAAFELLKRANQRSALIIFLISGGGSATLEWPRAAHVTLADMREMNRILVSCGATIAEVNAVRRALSSVKGGGLSARAPRAAQLTLIVSDTGADRIDDVASGPTIRPARNSPQVADVLAKYGLAARLPATVALALREFKESEFDEAHVAGALRRHYLLLDNERAVESAAEAARARDFVVESARDLSEQPVDEGAAELVSRLIELLRRRGAEGRGVCLVSGGEFSCPVRGPGVGGRNAETALRCAFELDARMAALHAEDAARVGLVALCAGTDGIDGNSPAAGALADHTTLQRAHHIGLDARRYLDESDAFNFFDALGDAIVIGPTGTNVRDLRILLAC